MGRLHQLSGSKLLTCLFGGLSICVVALIPRQVNAQTVIGFSGLQDNTEASIRTTCSGLAQIGTARNVLEQDLFEVCRSMVQNTNEFIGGPTAFSRGLNAEQLGSAYQNLTSEENFAPAKISTDALSGQTEIIASHQTATRVGGVGLTSLRGDESIGLAGFDFVSVKGGGAGGDNALTSNRIGGFINGIGGFGETDRTSREDPAEFNTEGVVAGVDYRITDGLILGIAGSYNYLEIEFDNGADVAGGEVNADTYSVSTYGTFYLNNFYIDGLFTYGWTEYEIIRNIFVGSNNATGVINRTANSNPDGYQSQLTLSAGYDFTSGGFAFGPYARVSHHRIQIESYTERGAAALNLAVSKQKIESLESVLGGQIAYGMSQSFGVVVPSAQIEWHHEHKDNGRVLEAQYINDPNNVTLVAESDAPDRDYFSLGISLSAVFQGGIETFIAYDTILDLDDIESHLFTAGARVEF